MSRIQRVEENIYEFSLYNKDVRNLVEEGLSHRHYDDDWSDTRYVQVKAANEERATTEIYRRYPKDRGFVYTGVVKFQD